MNYEEMSDFEINGYVLMHMRRFSWIEFVDGCASHVKRGSERSPGFAWIEVPDYCNNPSYALPIVYGNEISLVSVDDALWVARYGSVYSEGQNPLRAAMVVFLMMQEKAK